MPDNTTATKPKRPLPRSRQMVNDLTARCYADAWTAKERGEPVGWSTGVFAQEVCATFDVPVLYPENNAAALSARHYSEGLIQRAEGKLRYPMNICAYARLNLGLSDVFDDPDYPLDPAMPRPDFLLLANNSCTQLMKWYECLARDLEIPIFFLDCLFNYDNEEPAPHRVRFIRSQMERYIRQMEAFLGRPFDWDRFTRLQAVGMENCRLFTQVCDLNSRKPAPIDGFDLFNYMAPMVLCRCREETTQILLQLKAEILEHIENGTTTYRGEERYRVHWEGIACWPNLSYTLKTLVKYGINAVTNGYIGSWKMSYQPGNLDSMSRAYINTSTNSFNTEALMEKRAENIRFFGCDGMLGHVNRSCKIGCFNIFVGREMIERDTGVPCGSFDGDQSDSRVFSEAQYETRLQSLVEIMKERKEERHG